MSTEITATPVRTAIPIGGRPALGNAVGQLKSFAAQPAVAKSLPALGFAGLAGIAALVWMALSAPPARELFPAFRMATRPRWWKRCAAPGSLTIWRATPAR
jgi:hypothetical protein